MKPLPLLLAVSLLANGALAYRAFRADKGADATPPAASAKTTDSPSGASVVVTKEAADRAVAAEGLANAVKRGDAAGVRDHLRSLGLPDDVVRSAVRAVLFKPVVELSKEFANRQNKDGQAYWRTLPGTFSPQAMSKEDRAKMREANRAAMRELDALLGPDPQDATAMRYSYLPPEKLSKVRELEADYNELRSQLFGDQEGFRLPSDEEKMAYLEGEQRKDLATLLTPEELAEFDRRNSSTANRLRWQLRSFDASEAEYNKIFEINKAYDDKMRPNRGQNASADPSQSSRADAQRQLMADLKAALGEQRFNEYMRSQDPDYTTLKAAARRFDLPQETVDQVYSARDQAVTAAQRIANDASLSPEQRTKALAAIAEQTRTQVRSQLGGEIGTAYLRNSMRWLDALERGQSVSVGPTGAVIVGRPAQPGTATPANPPFTFRPSAPGG